MLPHLRHSQQFTNGILAVLVTEEHADEFDGHLGFGSVEDPPWGYSMMELRRSQRAVLARPSTTSRVVERDREFSLTPAPGDLSLPSKVLHSRRHV